MNFGGTVKLNPVGIFVLLGLSFISILYIFAGRSSDEKEVNLKELLIAAINVARKGGNLVKDFNNELINKRSKGKTKEGVPDLVTDADFGSHCIMYYSLHFAFPNLKIISEEKHAECPFPEKLDEILAVSAENAKINSFKDIKVPSKDVVVWIDPLDATKEFTEKLYEYVTTMVCVAVQGKPVIGVIHQPFDKHSTTSWVWLDKEKSKDLIVEKPKFSMEHPVITISRSHAGNVSNVIKKFIPQAEVVNEAGSGYKVLQLIKGYASAYIHTTLIKKWDICAGNAILNHLGGRLSTLSNENIDYSGTEVQVQNGILATLKDHKFFYEKLTLLKT